MEIHNPLILTFLGLLFVQVAFWLSFTRFNFSRVTHKTQEAQPVSIVVCAWNERKNLETLVPLLLNQDHPEYEVIIVDDRSTDGSYEFLVNLRKLAPRLKIVRIDTVPDHMTAKKFAVTLGVKGAQHDVILLTDADCRPRSDQWAKEMSSTYAEDTVFVLGYSPYVAQSSLLNWLIQYETLLTGIHFLSAALWKSPYMGVGRNLSYRKSFFLSKNGFSGFQNTMGGDDDLFVNRYATGKNTRICIAPDAIVDSIPKVTWSTYWIQKKRHLSVGKHYNTGDKIRLSLFSGSQILFWICFVTLAVSTLNPYLTIGGFGLRLILQIMVLGHGARKLSSKIPIFLLPLMDLIFSVFLPLISVPALLSKKVKWR